MSTENVTPIEPELTEPPKRETPVRGPGGKFLPRGAAAPAKADDVTTEPRESRTSSPDPQAPAKSKLWVSAAAIAAGLGLLWYLGRRKRQDKTVARAQLEPGIPAWPKVKETA